MEPTVRAPNEPPTSSVVKGPRQGFVESVDTNMTMLTKRLPELKFKDFIVGKHTQSKIKVVFLEGVADENIIKKVSKRLNDIKIDGVIDSHYILQFLQDKSLNIFHTIGSDEKPDITAAKLLEGRVAIIVDGSPIVLTVPYIFFEDIQNSDDYYTNHVAVSLRRFVRICGIAISIALPALYIAMQLYHYKIVPLNTLITITNSVQSSPFTPFVELLFVLILFEIFFEASLRIPRHIGAAMGLLGALILGEAAVQAGLISHPAVVVIALSSISMYIVPGLAPQISLLRLFFCLIAGILGLYGIALATIILIVYMCSIDSYGAPLMAPYAPLIKSDLKDAIMKKPATQMKTRPKSYENKNARRQKHEKN
jgi:spore germination protein KA